MQQSCDSPQTAYEPQEEGMGNNLFHSENTNQLQIYDLMCSLRSTLAMIILHN